eukprot:Hpha_TRINITY_DN13580_c0_g1::TRINITY_DN13580_c0_g1_i2::g.111631::m.111631
MSFLVARAFLVAVVFAPVAARARSKPDAPFPWSTPKNPPPFVAGQCAVLLRSVGTNHGSVSAGFVAKVRAMDPNHPQTPDGIALLDVSGTVVPASHAEAFPVPCPSQSEKHRDNWASRWECTMWCLLMPGIFILILLSSFVSWLACDVLDWSWLTALLGCFTCGMCRTRTSTVDAVSAS